MTITRNQRAILARMEAGQEHLGHDVYHVPAVLAKMARMGLIARNDHGPILEGYWTITPQGIAALEETQ